MTSQMARWSAGALGVAAAWCLAMPAAMAGTVGIVGRVTDASGKPVVGATVALDILAGEGYVKHDTVFVTTTSLGLYAVEATSPPELESYQILLRVTRRTAPYFKPASNIFHGPTVEGLSPFTVNWTLEPLPYGAVIEGQVTEKEFGVPIANHYIRNDEQFGGSTHTYSNGTYVMTLALPDATSRVVTLRTSGVIGGMRYYETARGVRIQAGQTQRADFRLVSDKEHAAYIWGRMISRQTGQPLPHASLFFFAKNCTYGTGCMPFSGFTAATDQFGRFAADLNIQHILQKDKYVVLRTNGSYWSNQHPRCASKDIIVTPAAFIGKAKEVNFTLDCP